MGMRKRVRFQWKPNNNKSDNYGTWKKYKGKPRYISTTSKNYGNKYL